MSNRTPASADMRRTNRFPVSRDIRAVNRQTGQEIGRVVNISIEGIMLLGSSPVEEDSILELALNSNDDPMDPVMLGVEALWCHSSEDGNGYWSGYFIIDISEQELERLLALAISDQA